MKVKKLLETLAASIIANEITEETEILLATDAEWNSIRDIDSIDITNQKRLIFTPTDNEITI
jgi:hypothetical protein